MNSADCHLLWSVACYRVCIIPGSDKLLQDSVEDWGRLDSHVMELVGKVQEFCLVQLLVHSVLLIDCTMLSNPKKRPSQVGS